MKCLITFLFYSINYQSNQPDDVQVTSIIVDFYQQTRFLRKVPVGRLIGSVYPVVLMTMHSHKQLN